MKLCEKGRKECVSVRDVVNGMVMPQLKTKTTYDNWCLQMKILLRSQDIWDTVDVRPEKLNK